MTGRSPSCGAYFDGAYQCTLPKGHEGDCGWVQGRVPSAERVVEVTIGLWDSSAVPRGQNPPMLARAILDALHDAGYGVSLELTEPARTASPTETPGGAP